MRNYANQIDSFEYLLKAENQVEDVKILVGENL